MKELLKTIEIIVLVTFTAFISGCHSFQKEFRYEINSLIYEDNFNTSLLNNWKVEVDSAPNAKVEIIDNKLIIDVDRGATVWFNRKLSGNLLFRYKRKVIMENGVNDRLSDMNQFWMANDPNNENLFTRKGGFAEYDSILMYYAGIGGNNNESTRFRKYLGNGTRWLIHDLQDSNHLLKPNHIYEIETIVYNGTIKMLVDQKEYFSFSDENPITSGYFGFRTTLSHHEIVDFKVYQLK